MSYEFAAKKRSAPVERHTERSPQPSLDALRSGAAMPTQEQLGRRVDLPDAMREKMETAFGADFSAVKLYESQAVADAGANAVAQGSRIAFAPGMLDFSSFGGQALLGHELSHVASQARGEVRGSGFLNDRALEARADREGAMAAAGQQIAAPTAAMSDAGAAPAAGPMQAGKTERRQRQAAEYRQKEIDAYDRSVLTDDPQEKAKYEAEFSQNRALKEGRLKKLKQTPEQIAANNAGVTSPIEQAKRASDRHLSPLRSADSRPDRKTKEEHYNAYIENLGRIMGSLKDDELKAQPDFQRHLVNEYASAHRALYGEGTGHENSFAEGESGSFLPGNGPDLLGTMYGRLMGADTIRGALSSGSVGDSMRRLNTSARESGVSNLMAMQYAKLPGNRNRTNFDFDRNFVSDTGSMRDLLQKVVTPAVGSAEGPGRRIGEIGQELDRMDAPPPEPEVKEPTLEEKLIRNNEEALRIMQTPIQLPPRPNIIERGARSVKDTVENAVDSVQKSVTKKQDEHKKKQQDKKEQKAMALQRRRNRYDFKALQVLDEKYGLGSEPTEKRMKWVYKKLGREWTGEP